MRTIAAILLCTLPLLLAQTSDEKEAIAAVQRLFDGMKAHDAAILRSVVLSDARLYSVRGQAAPSGRTIEEFVTQIASSKGQLVERFTGQPSVSIRGSMAQVWGEYEFLRDGKFTHCGVDSVGLFKTADGWKIATIAYTVETQGCKGH